MRRMIPGNELNGFLKKPSTELGSLSSPETFYFKKLDALKADITSGEIKFVGCILEYSEEYYGLGYVRVAGKNAFKIMMNMTVPNEDETGTITIGSIYVTRNDNNSYNIDFYDIFDNDVTDEVMDNADFYLVY